MATPRPALGHAHGRPTAGPTAGPTRSRSRRRAGVVLGATAAACAVLSSLPGTASADPAQQAQQAQLTQQVADASHQLEAVGEQLNQARTVLDQQRAAVAQADRAAADADARLHAMDGQIRQLARTAYTTGDVSRVDTLLTSRSPADLVAQMGTLDAIAGHQTAVVKQVSDAAAAARTARAAATDAAAAAQHTLDDVTAQQAQLQARIADYHRQYDALTAAQQQEVVQQVTGTPVVTTADPAPVARAVTRPAAVAAPAAPAPAVSVGSGSAAAAVRTALAQVGKPYAYGAAGPNAFDCSGLMQYSWGAAGVALPHSSSAQSRMGTPVPLSALQPGDLVFFYSPVSHVAMYVGNGNIVHASTEGQPVKVVSLASVPGATSARRVG